MKDITKEIEARPLYSERDGSIIAMNFFHGETLIGDLKNGVPIISHLGYVRESGGAPEHFRVFKKGE